MVRERQAANRRYAIGTATVIGGLLALTLTVWAFRPANLDPATLCPTSRPLAGHTVVIVDRTDRWTPAMNGALTERGLEVPGRSPRDIGFWLVDASGLLRILSPEPGRRVAPFLSAGVGLTQYRLGDGNVLSYIEAGSVYDGNDAPRFTAAGGLGFDIFTGWSWDGEPIGVRIEGTDHVALESPLRELDTGDRFGLVHNVRLTIGVFTGFGVLR